MGPACLNPKINPMTSRIAMEKVEVLLYLYFFSSNGCVYDDGFCLDFKVTICT